MGIGDGVVFILVPYCEVKSAEVLDTVLNLMSSPSEDDGNQLKYPCSATGKYETS